MKTNTTHHKTTPLNIIHLRNSGNREVGRIYSIILINIGVLSKYEIDKMYKGSTTQHICRSVDTICDLHREHSIPSIAHAITNVIDSNNMTNTLT